MRKHSVRKWLHALLDLLPLVVIPVFMVYSHRHQIDSYSVQRTEYNTIHMQQQIVNGLPSSLEDWVDNENNSLTYSNSKLTYENINNDDMNFSTTINFDYNANDILLFKINQLSIDEDQNIEFAIGDDVDEYTIGSSNFIGQVAFTQSLSNSYTFNYLAIFCYSYGEGNVYECNKIQLFNLTQMFGSGNEPTIDEFNTLFPNDYYAVDSNAVAYVPYTRTYNDTDIGSQIFYSLYNSVDKYFNCNKLFSFNGVYNWINFNLFGGNAPLMVDVVYQIIVYEFFMDLIFLIYSVFMFIIDFASNFLEYSFSWSRRGGR